MCSNTKIYSGHTSYPAMFPNLVFRDPPPPQTVQELRGNKNKVGLGLLETVLENTVIKDKNNGMPMAKVKKLKLLLSLYFVALIYSTIWQLQVCRLAHSKNHLKQITVLFPAGL